MSTHIMERDFSTKEGVKTAMQVIEHPKKRAESKTSSPFQILFKQRVKPFVRLVYLPKHALALRQLAYQPTYHL